MLRKTGMTEKRMNKRWKRMAVLLLAIASCVLWTAVTSAEAAVVQGETQIRQIMDRAFVNGDLEVSFTAEQTYSTNLSEAKREAERYAGELIGLLEETALKHGKLMNGTAYVYQFSGSREISYTFDISSQFTKNVTVLTSEKTAYMRALKALKNHDYKTNFYAEDAGYYDTFVLALQHHPEFNYNILIWSSSDGTCGYRAGNELTEAQIAYKMGKADEKAAAVVKKIIKKGMTKQQKLQAIHDYLVRNCRYDDTITITRSGYDDAYTAYGCLVKKTAVCQGYAAAFNLLAAKAGICSIAVAGDAGGGSHAWSYVKNGNTYRYIDATWDDPIPDRGSKAKVSRTYFYLTRSQLEKTHSWDRTEHSKKYVDYSYVLL